MKHRSGKWKMPVNDNDNINKRLIGTLSICRKAGKLVCGFDPSKDAVMNGKAPLVLTAADISPKTEKEIRFFSEKMNVTVIKTPVTMEELYFGIGKKTGIIAVCDDGFAKKLSEICGCRG